MKLNWLWLGMLICVAHADEAETNFNATAVLQRTFAQRAAKDLALKARLFVGRAEPVGVEMLVRNTATETRTIYRTGQTELLVVQPVAGATRWFLKGTGELTGARRAEKFAGSQFTYYELGAPFLHWPEVKAAGLERFRGRNCYVVEFGAEDQPYRRAKAWLDQEFYGLVRAELYDANDGLVRRLSITSFKRLGEFWIPRGIEVAFVPANQALPAEEKSRLEVFDGEYDAPLPVEWFAEAKFGTGPR